jgi:hypothetical protein
MDGLNCQLRRIQRSETPARYGEFEVATTFTIRPCSTWIRTCTSPSIRIRWPSYGYIGAGCELATMSSMLPTTINLSCSFAWEFKGAEQSVAAVATARIPRREGFNIAIASWRMRRTEFDRFHRIQTGGFNRGITTQQINPPSVVFHAKTRWFENKRGGRIVTPAMPGTRANVIFGSGDCPTNCYVVPNRRSGYTEFGSPGR